ncbi:hypothetical protein ACK325_02515 [Aeromonas hydrophila]|uniref:hypothetical protein n=1 Tax=Aeromonas hydrophila TaxID=644 RepID=UPI003989E722
MSRPKSYTFALLSMKSNFNSNYEAFESEVDRQRADLKARISNNQIIVNEWVRVDVISKRQRTDDVFLAAFEVINEFECKIVTIDDAYTIKNELLKNPLWFETADGSPIKIGFI